MTFKNFCLSTIFFCAAFISNAQTDSPDKSLGTGYIENTASAQNEKPDDKVPGRTLNVFKVNLTGLVMKNYAFQYERVLNKRVALALQYRIMPTTGIPFKQTILKAMEDEDPDTRKIIDEFRMSNYAITPEVRFYLSRKGYGRGFYLAPFYRYASFTSNDLNVFYTDEFNTEHSIKMNGKLTSNTVGLLLGVQSNLGKHVVLDISFFGPHYGAGNGNFKGTSSQPLSQSEQDDLRQQLEDMEIPLTRKTVTVNANGAMLDLDGPWGGYRFAISLGVRF